MKKKEIIVFILSLLIFAESNSQNVTTYLNQNLKFHKAGDKEWVPATVPGTVHTDLLKNKKIPDPFYRFNEKEVQWIENEDWEYTSVFEVKDQVLAKEFVELEFEGLDTYAEVFLNEIKILSTDNMFRSYVVDVKKNLKEGQNEIRILFHSPIKIGLEKLHKLPYLLPATNEQAPIDKRTNVFTRKAPYHYGWDWGPRLVTSGIWRPIKLKAYNVAKIKDLSFEQTSFSNSRVKYLTKVEIAESSKENLVAKIFLNGKEISKSTISEGKEFVQIPFEINKPELWWCNGLGKPFLYDVKISLSTEKNLIDEYSTRLGVRHIELMQEPDSVGYSFYFKLNGIAVYVKGTNYIPGDNFIPRIKEEEITKIVKAAADANMNMIRVWGVPFMKVIIFMTNAMKMEYLFGKTLCLLAACLREIQLI